MVAMVGRAWIFTKQTWISFSRHSCPQLAAAISYYALFSIIPAAILGVSVLGLFLANDDLRKDVIQAVLDTIPLTEDEGRDAVEQAVDSVQSTSVPVAVLGLVATLWTASSMFGSIRRSLDIVWDVEEHRPWAQGKVVDLVQIGLLGSIMLSSLALTGVLRAAREVSGDYFGPLAGENPLWEIPPFILPAVLSFVTFTLLYRIVPASHPAMRDVIPGALIATLLFEALKNSFAFYVANFNNYDVVYGSLAGVLLFLFFTYLSSSILLMGAEVTRTFRRYHNGELDELLYPVTPQPSVMEQTLRAVKGLFVRQP